MYIVKVTLGNEIKRIAFDGTASFEELRKLVKTLFPTLADGYVLKYKDEDGDIISIFSDLELKEAFRQIEHQPAPQVLRLFVNEYIELAESKVEVKPVVKAEVKPIEEKPEELQPKYAKLESLYPAVRPQVIEPVPEVKPAPEPQRQIQKLAEFDLLKVIERNLQKFVSSISTLVGHLNIPEKITHLVEVCQKHLKTCQDKASEIGQGINTFAKQTTDDFLSEFALLKSEVKKLSQEVAKEVRNKADEQKERKENGQIYFPPLLLFSTSEPKPVESVVQSQVAPQPEVAPVGNDDLSESELAELIEHFEIEKSEQAEEKPVTTTTVALTEQQKADLAVLEGMGFSDQAKNLPLLAKHNGNLVAVVEELLSM
jgi:archaellum component FlaC